MITFDEAIVPTQKIAVQDIEGNLLFPPMTIPEIQALLRVARAAKLYWFAEGVKSNLAGSLGEQLSEALKELPERLLDE